MTSTGEQVVHAVACGCTGALRAEVRRLVQGADSRLLRYGHDRDELAVIANALAHSDQELAITMAAMSDETRDAAVHQLDDALEIGGNDSIERMAAGNFRAEAARVIELIGMPQFVS